MANEYLKAIRIKKADGTLSQEPIPIGTSAENVSCNVVIGKLIKTDVQSALEALSTGTDVASIKQDILELQTATNTNKERLDEIAGYEEGGIHKDGAIDTLNSKVKILQTSEKVLAENVDTLMKKVYTVKEEEIITSIWTNTNPSAYYNGETVSDLKYSPTIKYLILYKKDKNVSDAEIKSLILTPYESTSIRDIIFVQESPAGTEVGQIKGTYTVINRDMSVKTAGETATITFDNCRVCSIPNPFTLSEDNVDLTIDDIKAQWNYNNDFLIPLEIRTIERKLTVEVSDPKEEEEEK